MKIIIVSHGRIKQEQPASSPSKQAINIIFICIHLTLVLLRITQPLRKQAQAISDVMKLLFFGLKNITINGLIIILEKELIIISKITFVIQKKACMHACKSKKNLNPKMLIYQNCSFSFLLR